MVCGSGRVAGSFALVARAGKTVKLARSLDRPLRFFLPSARKYGADCRGAHRYDSRLA